MRALAKEIMAKKVSGATFHIFLSHFHYDHIQGIPFFAPAYAPSNRVVFHGGHQGIEKFLRAQMSEPFFPIGFDTLGAEISFEEHKPGDVIEVCDSRITLFQQNHPGLSYGYRSRKPGESHGLFNGLRAYKRSPFKKLSLLRFYPRSRPSYL